MSSIPWGKASAFDSFNILEETYKTVSGLEIKTAVLLPKDLKPGSHPLILYLHGGFFVMAYGLFAPFWPNTIHTLAIEHGAIIVAPDYRLLPTENGISDSLEDVEDVWLWTKSRLPGILSAKTPGHSLDFSRTLNFGASAGGYFSAQLSLSHPDDFQVLGLIYPGLNMKDHIYVTGPTPEEPNILRMATEDMPSKEEVLAWIEDKRSGIHSQDDFSRIPYVVAACHHGIFFSHIFDNKGLSQPSLYPLERIQAGERLAPRIWVLHGVDDSTVRIQGSDNFVKLVREMQPHTILRYDAVPGQDHAFDLDEKSWESIRPAALDFVIQGWLSQ